MFLSFVMSCATAFNLKKVSVILKKTRMPRIRVCAQFSKPFIFRYLASSVKLIMHLSICFLKIFNAVCRESKKQAVLNGVGVRAQIAL